MIYICAQPSTFYYAWQIDTMILSFSKCGVNLSSVHIVSNDINDPHFLKVDRKWSKHGVKFSYYHDTRENVKYISSIRPHLLEKHWKENPELVSSSIFYHDCDIALTKPIPDLLPKLSEQTCYVSDTISYVGAKYIESKGHGLLDEMCKIVVIDPGEVVANENGSGGAQYLLQPGIDSKFWSKVYTDSENLFDKISTRCNQIKKENPDWHELQIWCADMWAVLWNLWKEGYETECHEDLDFTWGTSLVDLWDKNAIYHNAGVTGQSDGEPFYKGAYMHRDPILAPRPNDKWASQKYYDLVVEAWNATRNGEIKKQIIRKRV